MLARSGHRERYRKRQLGDSSMKAGMNKWFTPEKPVNCRGQHWAVHPAWKKPPMNAKV